MYWQTNWLIDWLEDWLTDWLIDWLTHWQIEWLMHWLIDSLTDSLNDCLIDFICWFKTAFSSTVSSYWLHTAYSGWCSIFAEQQQVLSKQVLSFFSPFNYHACTPVEQERALQSVFAQTKSHFWSSVSLTCSICQADNCKQAGQEATLHFSLMACFAVIFAFLFSQPKYTKSSIYRFVVLLIGRYCGLMVQDGTLSSEVWVQVQVLVFVLCSWARYSTLIVPTSI